MTQATSIEFLKDLQDVLINYGNKEWFEENGSGKGVDRARLYFTEVYDDFVAKYAPIDTSS